jgi:hypothetical protein
MPRPSPRAARRSHAVDEAATPDGTAGPPARALGDEPSGSGPAPVHARDEVETVALALETIALRVRVGEFRVRGLLPGMSDAAILAATLASILAPRR